MKCYIHQDIDAVGTCTNCGKTVCQVCASEVDGKVVCKQCVEKIAGQAQAQTQASSSTPGAAPVRPLKEPFLALALAFIGTIIFVGFGAVYNGQVKKGICLSIINWVLWIVFYGITIVSLFICCLVMIIPIAFDIWVWYDSYQTAKKINAGEPIKDWLE